MKKLRSLLVLLTAISIISCETNDDQQTDELFFSGFYKINSIITTDAVDLNNDGRVSYDLKNEIDHYFNNEVYDLEIRPNYTNDTTAKLISFYLPEPYVYFDAPGNPEGYVEYGRAAFGMTYSYNGKIVLDETQTENEFAHIKTFELREDQTIRATILKDYYDFGNQAWQRLSLEIVYVKLD